MTRAFPTIGSWPALQAVYERLTRSKRRWVFRGQKEPWPLKSSLERVARDRFQEPFSKLRYVEERVTREFQRHFHRYSNIQVAEADGLRWLAIMQHHGAPTRLLDWTYSFHVALYFAAESAALGKEGVIWAIDLDWCWRVAEAAIPKAMTKYQVNDKDLEATRDLLSSDRRLLVALSPFSLDERIAVQQGLFLAPLDMTRTFEASLNAMQGSGDGRGNVRGIRIRWNKAFLTKTITELQRMNINRRSLYPGLDGLATGLHNWIATLYLMPLHRDRR